MIETAKSFGRNLALTSSIVAALAIGTAPGTAYAQRGWVGGGGWHGGGWHGGGWHGGGGISPGAAVALGLGAFALGGALAYPSYGYGYPYYGYAYPAYGYGYGYPNAYSDPYDRGGYLPAYGYGGGYAPPYEYGYEGGYAPGYGYGGAYAPYGGGN